MGTNKAEVIRGQLHSFPDDELRHRSDEDLVFLVNNIDLRLLCDWMVAGEH